MDDASTLRLAIMSLLAIALVCIASHVVIEVFTKWSDTALLPLGATAVGAIGGILVPAARNDNEGEDS